MGGEQNVLNGRAAGRRAGARWFVLGLALAALGLAQAASPKAASAATGSKASATRVAAVKAKAARRAPAVRASGTAARTSARKKASAGSRIAPKQERLALRRKASASASATPPRLSFGQKAGLHGISDPLDLKSAVALVVDQDTNEVLLAKNDHAVLPIASITKLMTGLVVSESGLSLDEPITIVQDDVDTEKGSRSRLLVGTTLTRGELLHLALMSSENRAAHALGRSHPGGLPRFVEAMNARAALLGMSDTRYVEPTGLSSSNRSSAQDLAVLVGEAYRNPLLRQLSTSPGQEVAVGSRLVQFRNTNGLVRNPDWDIGLQKTGYISEAGRCLVMQTRIAGRGLIMVFLDSAGRYSRLGDAERVRRWVELQPQQGAQSRADPSSLSG